MIDPDDNQKLLENSVLVGSSGVTFTNKFLELLRR